MSTQIFYWRHLRTPLLLFALIALLLAVTPLDISIAHALFYNETSSHWIGASSWWTNELLHRDGSWLIRTVGALAIALLASTWWRPDLRELRRPAWFLVLSMALSIGLVGLLKAVTNVDCPRDLTEFGGAFPFIHLFEHRPEALRQAHCFPAAHASSGYALLALYFVLRERSRKGARLGLAAGLVFGLVFGIAQQARGAHFVSHDVWSAMLVWTVSLSLYTFAFKARLWNVASLHRTQWECNEASAAAPSLPVDGDADLPCRAGAVSGP
jgi:membrane-associated PAP2 superfamily phosphatase